MLQAFYRLGTFLAALAATTPALAECYHKKGDQTEILREGEDGTMIWEHKGKRVEFTTASAGTGIDARVAYAPNMKGFRYEYAGENLVFSGVTYVAGCK